MGREHSSPPLLSNLGQDVRFAIQALRGNPAFSVAAIFTLALGIGANTTVFSVADAALFRPLPYRDADRLAVMYRVNDPFAAEKTFVMPIRNEEVERWREQTQIFEDIEPYDVRTAQLEGADDPVLIARVSARALELLGIPPVIGRAFDSREGLDGSDSVTIISSGLWARIFGSDPSALGSSLTLDGRSYTVIGVMPQAFKFPENGVQVWVPFVQGSTTRILTRPPLVKIREGLTRPQAQAEADRIAQRLDVEQPRRGSQGSRFGWSVALLDVSGFGPARVRTPLLILLGAVGLVLLMTCVNVANLLLMRTVVRRRELALRSALGASPSRLFRQLTVEGLVLATLAGTAVIVVNYWTIEAMGRGLPAALGLGEFDIRMDRRLLVFAAATSFATGMMCSLFPAARAMRPNLTDALAVTPNILGGNTHDRRARGLLVATAVALAFVVLVGAGLLANSFVRMVLVNVGFDPVNLVAIRLQLPQRYDTKTSQNALFEAVVAAARELPSVRAVSTGSAVPPTQATFSPGGTDDSTPTDEGVPILTTTVDSRYLGTLGLRAIEGRLFDETDIDGGQLVAVIDRRTAEHFWDTTAVGKRLRIGGSWLTVVGVVDHVKNRTFVTDQDRFQAYLPYSQEARPTGTRILLVRGGDSDALIPALRSLARRVDPEIRISQAGTVEASFDTMLALPRFFLIVMSVFATLALAIASVGLYAVLTHSVTRRTREIGVRLALGADRTAVELLVIREALMPVVAGLALGLVGAFWLTRYLQAQLYGVAPRDLGTILGVGALLLLTTVLAASLPARRAARLEPVTSLRHE